MMKYGDIDDTLYFHFGSNDTSGSGDDGASAACDVRLCGAAAGAAPVYSPTPSLLSHASYPAGCYEVAIAATVANGFADGEEYAVFCTLAVDGQNPTGFVGSFKLGTKLWTSDEMEQIRDALGVDGDKTTAAGGQLQTVDANIDSILADTGTDGVVVAAASKTGYALTSAEHTNIADELLTRDWTAVTGEAARSVLNALRFLRNKWSIAAGTLTVCEEDDSTPAWTSSLTDDSGADPITASDPA